MKESLELKLEKMAERYEELGQLLSDAEVISNQEQFKALSKEYAQLEPIVSSFNAFHQAKVELEDAKALLEDDDPEMRAMANDEIESAIVLQTIPL